MWLQHKHLYFLKFKYAHHNFKKNECKHFIFYYQTLPCIGRYIVYYKVP